MPSKDQKKQKTIRITVEISIAILFILLAIRLSGKAKAKIENILVKRVQLTPGSEAFSTWLNPPIATTRTYYLFNITNALDVVMDPNNENLNVTDSPPYSYNVTTEKTNVTWSEDNKIINYSVERLITRHSTKFTSASLNDTGVFINLLRAIFRTQFGPKANDAFYILGKYNSFYSSNAIEQLEGFTSELFHTIRDKMIGPNTDKYGFLYRQNGSRLYNVSIQTVKKGEVLTFASELTNFNINSSNEYRFPLYDGLTYPPMLFNKPILNIFNADFCKPFLVYFNREVTKFGGIKLHEYKLKLINYDNCTNSTDTQTCEEVDQIDVSKCISSSLAPRTIFLSKAHFYGTNFEKINQMKINGFQPNSDKHDSFVYFEPYTGTPFHAIFRLQLNINATIDQMKESDEGFERLEPVNKRGVKRLIPIFWIDQQIDLSEKMIRKLRIPLLFVYYPRYFLAAIVIIISIIFIILIEFLARRSAKTIQYTRGTSL